ncbi:MAG: trigger factor [Verrucomicrobia bacterium]|nr:MAG: trigger factor [Verrucomicrobiota bacterium]
MKCIVEELGPCRKKLNIEFTAEEAGADYGDALKGFTKAARIPGFRPGKAPAAMVQRHYGKEIAEEIRDRLVARGYHGAVEQHKLDVVEVLDLTEAKYVAGQPLTFSVTVDVPPQFEVPSYKGIALTGRKVEVKDDEVEGTLKGMLERQAKFEDVTGRAVQKGDLVQVDYVGTSDGKPVTELAPEAAGLGKMDGYWMLIEEEHALLPGLGMALVGAAIGETKQAAVKFPADFSRKELAGKTASYTVTVKAIRERKLPGNYESLLKPFGVENEEKLRERIRKDLQTLKENQEQQQRRNAAAKQLLDSTKIEVPESVVQRETQSAVYDVVSRNMQRGVAREEIESHRGEIFEAAKRSAVDDIKLRYILHKIAEAEAVEVSAADLDAEIQRIAGQQRMTPQQARAALIKNERLDGLRDALRRDKALDFVLAQAQVTETTEPEQKS